jgi:hypothetical protein
MSELIIAKTQVSASQSRRSEVIVPPPIQVHGCGRCGGAMYWDGEDMACFTCGSRGQEHRQEQPALFGAYHMSQVSRSRDSSNQCEGMTHPRDGEPRRCENQVKKPGMWCRLHR